MDRTFQKKIFLKADLPEAEAHSEISPPMIPTRIRPLLMIQPAIQVVMILEATLHRIVEGLTIKSVEILRNRSMGQRFSHSRTVYWNPQSILVPKSSIL